MKIKTQITSYFLALSILLAVAFSITLYLYAKKNVETLVLDHLKQVASIKKNRIKDMMKEVEFSTETLSRNGKVLKLVQEINKGKVYKREHLEELLNAYRETWYRFKEISIVNPSGRIISSTTNLNNDSSIANTKLFESGMKVKNRFDKVYLNKEKELSLLITERIELYNNVLGLLVVELRLDDFSGVSNDYTGLGRSGETILASKQDNGVYITSLKYDRKAAFRRKVLTEEPISAMAIALKGKEGIWLDAYDYTGKEVMAVTNFIDGPNWGMVTKIDKSEAYENLVNLQETILLINLVYIPLAFLIAFLLSRNISNPIIKINELVNRIKEGDLSKRVPVQSKNEVGQLAQSFNHMVIKLEKQISNLDKFAYIVSHDLKAPLQSIQSLVDIISETDHKKLTGDSITAFEMIKAKASIMENLIHEILYNAKKGGYNSEKINLEECVMEVLSFLDPPNKFSFKVQTLPEVKFNKAWMFQIFQNLLSNAIKYNDKEAPVVIIDSEELDGYYKINIIDNGIGIPKEKLDTIFDLFSTVHNKEIVDSHGIGLYTVKKIITDSGGDINVESVLGKGTKISFTIKK